jgi:hypothetical protein
MVQPEFKHSVEVIAILAAKIAAQEWLTILQAAELRGVPGRRSGGTLKLVTLMISVL